MTDDESAVKRVEGLLYELERWWRDNSDKKPWGQRFINRQILEIVRDLEARAK